MTYPDRDSFNRITSSRWTKDLATDVDFVDLDVAYDRAGNVASVEDNIYTGFDVLYSNDGLNRLTDADEGTLSGGSISSRTRRQLWTLSQTGNWPEMQLDLNGNGTLTDTGDLDEARTHSLANEILTRDVDSNATVDYTLTHDAVGNLTDDGQTWKYTYDAFGRLKELRKRSDDSLLAEYTYYGNNLRASEHYDADADGDVDSNDPTYFFAWDEGWRLAAVYRGSDSSPKERFLHHQAGNSGHGGSSYIDDLVLRDRDANTAWTSASDGTLEQQRYYCQNWRHDVVAMVTSDGKVAERARYSAYGVAFGIPLGDVNGDGACDSTDVGLYTPTPSGVRYDLNLDGTINASDSAIASGNTGVTLGVGKLSNIGNRFGYAGYESDFATDLLMHVRNRVYHAALGRWTRRDPLGYVDGASLYQYVGSMPNAVRDAMGLAIGLGCQGYGGPGECPGSTPVRTVVAITSSQPDMQQPPTYVPGQNQCCDSLCKPPAGGKQPQYLAGCDNGKQVVCQCIPSAPTPGSEACKPLKDAFLQCAPACEALHFKRTCCPPTDCSPAKDCTPSPAVPDGDPAVQPGAPMSCNRACSELAVYECMLQCAQSAMSAQRTNVPPDCAAKWQALIQGLESDIASLRWACYMCDHKPGDFPFDPNGPAYASVGVGNRASQ
ncbi:MAG: RHS repeat-associated core domain-containing protein [Phycisphaerales bacterium]